MYELEAWFDPHGLIFGRVPMLAGFQLIDMW